MKVIAALLGVAVVVLQGIQGVFQFHETWLRHKKIWIALEGEKSLFLAEAGHYASSDHPQALLAEKVQELVAGEVNQFMASQQQRRDLDLAAQRREIERLQKPPNEEK